MQYVIKSRSGKEYSFFMPSGGGYVRLEGPQSPGTLGRQICNGGGFMGSTIAATEENFKRVCKNWYRSHLRNN